jgi:hypothetical protein
MVAMKMVYGPVGSFFQALGNWQTRIFAEPRPLAQYRTIPAHGGVVGNGALKVTLGGF